MKEVTLKFVSLMFLVSCMVVGFSSVSFAGAGAPTLCVLISGNGNGVVKSYNETGTCPNPQVAVPIATGDGGAEDFTDLGDTPSDYSGAFVGDCVVVNDTTDGLEFADCLEELPASTCPSIIGGAGLAVNAGTSYMPYFYRPTAALTGEAAAQTVMGTAEVL